MHNLKMKRKPLYTNDGFRRISLICEQIGAFLM